MDDLTGVESNQSCVKFGEYQLLESPYHEQTSPIERDLEIFGHKGVVTQLVAKGFFGSFAFV